MSMCEYNYCYISFVADPIQSCLGDFVNRFSADFLKIVKLFCFQHHLLFANLAGSGGA